MPSTTDTREYMRPGAAFDTITGALAGLHDTAYGMRAWPVVSEVKRLLVAAYELLRDGHVGDRAQQLAAAMAACSGRQPTLLVQRGLRIDLIAGAPHQSEMVDQNIVLVLCMAVQSGILRRCEQARQDTVAWLWPNCQHPWCAVVGQLDRQAGA